MDSAKNSVVRLLACCKTQEWTCIGVVNARETSFSSRIWKITVPRKYSPEGGWGKLLSGGVVRPNYPPEGGSGKLPSGRLFGRITLRKVVRGNYSRAGGSAELLSRRWLGEITLGEVVRPNYSPEGTS